MKTNNYPLVSIIINCFNGEGFIEKAIQSVLDQTYNNFELIIWDNQSTDGSAKSVMSFQDKRIIYYYSDTHTKLYEARNKAVEKSNGEFICFLDCDDWWHKTKIDKQIKKFQEGNFAVVYSNQRIIFQKKTRFGKNFDETICKLLSRNHIYNTKIRREGRILSEILGDYKVGIATAMIKRKFFNGFDNRYHVIGDFEFIIRIAAKEPIGYVDQILAFYRVHGNNESFIHRKLQIRELSMWFNETKKNKDISALKNFKNLEYKIKYLRAMDDIGDKNYKYPINFIFNLPLSFWKLKLRLLIILLSPSIIVKIFRT